MNILTGDWLFPGHEGTVHGREDAEAEILAVPHETFDVVPTAR